jgi:NAD kinase
MDFENAIVIVNKTRLDSLIERFNTKAQARFYIEHSGGDFQDYLDEHDTFQRSLDKVVGSLQRDLKLKVVGRKFVPNFLFGEKDVVVVVGQDGLVANAAKYVKSLPILAINPDTSRNDGILLPFDTENFEQGWHDLANHNATFNEVTLAEALTNDGQRLLAFNDLFIGPASHTSARYALTYRGETEQQSSSGIIVSTGAGSTGWLSSVFNMANSVIRGFGHRKDPPTATLAIKWDTPGLAFVVREPFRSKHSGIKLSVGGLVAPEKLVIESYMPSNGIIFSDGIEADFAHFNSGNRVEIGVAAQKARLLANTH